MKAGIQSPAQIGGFHMYAGQLTCPGVSQGTAFTTTLDLSDNYYPTSKHISTLVVSQSAAQRSKMEKNPKTY